MDLTILIISYKSLEKLNKCLSTIGEKRSVLIVENSNDLNLKDSIEKEFKNSKVILNNSNLGYAKASNIGFKISQAIIFSRARIIILLFVIETFSPTSSSS